MKIIPAIYPETFEEIADKIYVVGDYSRLIQIDICDGYNGLRNSWLPTGKEILPPTFHYEFDLLVTQWRDFIFQVYKLGARRVVVHVDRFTYDDYEELFKLAHEYEMTIGLTISNDVSVDLLVYAARKIQESSYFKDFKNAFIQVTAIRDLGENEHPFDERALSRIRILKNFFPNLVVQVSGRINPETAKLVKHAGADSLVVGSYIFGHEDIHEAMESLKKALEEDWVDPVVEISKKEEPALPKKEEPKPKVEQKKPPETFEQDYDPSKEEIKYDFGDDLLSDKE